MADTKTIKKVNGLRIKLRSDVEKNWKESNPILLKGEFAYISDKKQFMIGDGVLHMFIDESKGITKCLELAGGGEALIARSLIGVAQYEKNDDGTDKEDDNGNKIIATDANGNVIYDAAKINGVTFDGTKDIEIHNFDKKGITVDGLTTTKQLAVNETSNFYDNVTITGGDLEITSSKTEGGNEKGGTLQVAGTSQLSGKVTAGDGVEIAVKDITIEEKVDDGNGNITKVTKTETPDALTVTGKSQFNGNVTVADGSTITGKLEKKITFVTHAGTTYATTTSADGTVSLNTEGNPLRELDETNDGFKGSYDNTDNLQIPVNDANGFLLLDGTAKIPNWALPGSIDEIKSYTELSDLPLPGTDGKIYFVKKAYADVHDLDGDSKTEYVSAVYRWAGTDVTEEDQAVYDAAKEAGDKDAMLNIIFNITKEGETTKYGNKYYVEINSNMGTADKAYQLTNIRTFSINTTVEKDGSVVVDEKADITAPIVSFDGTQNVNLQAKLKNIHNEIIPVYTVDPDGKVKDEKHSQHSVGAIEVDAQGRVTSIGKNVLITPKWSSIVETSTDKGLDVAAATGKDTIAENEDVKLATWIEGKQYISNLEYTGNAATATKLNTARTFEITGDATGSVESDLAGKENGAEVSINLTLSDSGVDAGEYGTDTAAADGKLAKHQVPYVEVDVKGRVIKASQQELKWTDLADVDDTKGKADGSVYNKGLTIQAKDRIATWQYLLNNEQKEGYIDAIRYTGVAAAADTLNTDDFVYIFDCGDATDEDETKVTDDEETTMKGAANSTTDSNIAYKEETQTTTE